MTVQRTQKIFNLYKTKIAYNKNTPASKIAGVFVKSKGFPKQSGQGKFY